MIPKMLRTAGAALAVLCMASSGNAGNLEPSVTGTATPPVQPTWESIRENYATPAWFTDAKFGIFIHWGLYAVPAHHNEWYARHMYSNTAIEQWHVQHFGPPDKFGYKDFIPLFKAERYDPDAWAALFRESGARYVIPVAEHHDGFAMYDSDLTRWCAAKMGPKRDLIGDLAKAVRKEGLVFGLSSHRMEHHDFMYPQLKVANDLFDPAYADFYGPPQPGDMNDGNASAAFQADWLARCKELVDKYHPQMFWFDNGVNDRNYDPIKQQFAAYYFNQARTWPGAAGAVSVSAKSTAFPAGSILDFEKAGRGPKAVLLGAWQIDDQIATNSWGFVTEIKYRSTRSIVAELVDTVSKGGNLLLNISPKADGTIPDEQQMILRAVGKWLRVNGQAIYGTRPYTRFGDGTFRYTTRDGALYAIGLSRPARPEVTIPLTTADGIVKQVQLLGQTGDLKFTQDTAGLHVTLPKEMLDDLGWTLKLSGTTPMPSFPKGNS